MCIAFQYKPTELCQTEKTENAKLILNSMVFNTPYGLQLLELDQINDNKNYYLRCAHLKDGQHKVIMKEAVKSKGASFLNYFEINVDGKIADLQFSTYGFVTGTEWVGITVGLCACAFVIVMIVDCVVKKKTADAIND